MTSPSSALLTVEDMRIRVARLSLHESAAYRHADDQDYAAMQACRCDGEAIDDMRVVGISRRVAVRTHHGYLAFRSLV